MSENPPPWFHVFIVLQVWASMRPRRTNARRMRPANLGLHRPQGIGVDGRRRD
ncbi:hypothetical protein THITH_08535 [Thioalkalivibrio paradoxus ARh 1]|uniref:Uncharacterized protein n=1 Tax=Thioalkalivibrio paradoxus ARh 1 TaxID=713585 RepID=W0DS26_9GAMM|nr:hypothetical protein THITH_08535 [Thioalkalivibrio paradoxus ARh 1]